MGSCEESISTANCNVNDIDLLKLPPYFVTTLGQAKHLNTLYDIDKEIGREDNIISLIDSRAESYPDVPVVGEFLPTSGNKADGWVSRCISECRCMLARKLLTGVLDFSQLTKGTSALALHMIRRGTPVAERPPTRGDEAEPFQQPTVALLCSSSVDFLFHWLSLIRLGYAVLLLA